MSKHTKGPWRVAENKWFITSDSGMIAELEHAPEWKENGNLIAAAPEMFKLLEDSLFSIGGDWRKRRDEILNRIMT